MVRSSPVLGVLAPLVGGYYHGRVLTGIAAVARARGAAMLAVQTSDAGTSNTDRYELPRQMGRIGWDYVDAFVVLQDAARADDVRRLQDTGKPVVVVGQSFADVAATEVGPDNVAGVRAAVEHLVWHGHERIAFAGGGMAFDVLERVATYESALRQHGITPDPALRYLLDGETPWANSQLLGEQVGQQMLADGLPSTAVVCATDMNAVGLVRTLVGAGRVLPNEQAIVGFDDTEAATGSRPPLTTVRHDFTEVGTFTANLVLDHLAGAPLLVQRYLAPTRLVVRESCGCSGHAATPGAVDQQPAEQLRAELERIIPDDTASANAAIAAVVRWAESSLTGTAAASTSTTRVFEALYAAAPRNEAAAAAPAALAALARFFGDAAPTPAVAVHATAAASGVLTSLQLASEFAVTQRLERMLATQYSVNMQLVARDKDARQLGWAADTGARTVCLATWTDDGDGGLRIAGWYDRDGATAPAERDTNVAAFPPRQLLDRATADELALVLPVRAHGDDCGLLAVVSSIDTRAYGARHTFNEWTALLRVALAHDDVLTRLQHNRDALHEAYERERELREEVRVSEERYAIAVGAAKDGLFDWDIPSNTVYYSDACCDILGVAPQDLTGTPSDWFTRVHPDDEARLRQILLSERRTAQPPIEHEHRIVRDGVPIWILVRAARLRDEHGQTTRLVGSLTDVTGRRQREEQLRRAAFHDPLTGLANRALFLERLNAAIERRRHDPQRRFAVFFIDLNGFKAINDRHGHHSGDTVLAAVANSIRGALRDTDTGARFGGDEFAVLVDALATPEDVVRIAERLQAWIARPVTVGDVKVRISASVGAAVSDSAYVTGEDMLQAADQAMYAAKASQRALAVAAAPLQERAEAHI